MAIVAAATKGLTRCNDKLHEIHDKSALAAKKLEVARAEVEAAEKQTRSAD